MVVKVFARSGAWASAGASVSRSQRCFPVSAAVFIEDDYNVARLQH
jgi:hypothetical protein